MEHLTKEDLILQAIYGSSFLKFVLYENNFFSGSGYLLVTENPKNTAKIIQNFKFFDDTTIYQNWNTKSKHPFNYETGVLYFNRYIKDSAVYDFLQQDNFLPLVIIDEIIPESLRDKYLIIPFEISEDTFSDFLPKYRFFKDFMLENLEYIIREINLFKTERLYHNNNISPDYVSLYRFLIVVGKVWKLFERNNSIAEQICESHYHKYVDYIIELLNTTECYENEYEVKEAVKSIVISYFEKNSILIADTLHVTNELLEKLKEMRVIFQDPNYYYFPEKFFQKISEPLLKSVSFLQLKNEMHQENILVCDESKQKNYTIKKMYFNTDTCRSYRMRFLKFPKNVFETDEGLPLDMIVNTKPKINIVKVFKPTGGTESCSSK